MCLCRSFLCQECEDHKEDEWSRVCLLSTVFTEILKCAIGTLHGVVCSSLFQNSPSLSFMVCLPSILPLEFRKRKRIPLCWLCRSSVRKAKTTC